MTDSEKLEDGQFDIRTSLKVGASEEGDSRPYVMKGIVESSEGIWRMTLLTEAEYEKYAKRRAQIVDYNPPFPK
jgi:hypothetical protein